MEIINENMTRLSQLISDAKQGNKSARAEAKKLLSQLMEELPHRGTVEGGRELYRKTHPGS